MKKIGFIGLGIMGYPMASHLLDAGYEIIVYNRTQEKALKLLEKGATVAKSPSEVARESEIVFTMLANSDVVEELVLRDGGVIEGAREGLILINSSTVSPRFNIALHAKLAERNIIMLDVPVTGSGVQANAGTLTFMCGGDYDTYHKCIPMFEAMGNKSFYMGKIGAGSYTKLANNTMLALNMMSLAEAITMVSKCGIDPEIFVDVVSGGGSKSAMAESKTPKIVKRDFSPNFKASLMLKDIKLALELADDINLPTPFLSLSRELLQILKNKGYGEEDLCSVVKIYEEWSGITVHEK